MFTTARILRVLTGLVLTILAAAAAAGAGTVTVHYTFPEPEVTDSGDYVSVAMDGTWNYGAPGEPVLPMSPARVLLPPGEIAVEIDVQPGERIKLGEGYVVEVGQHQYPLSFDGPVRLLEPDYEGRGPFPGRLNDAPRNGLLRGHSIATLALHPVEYDPASGGLYYYRSLDVVVTTTQDAEAMAASSTMSRRTAETRRRVSRVVDNPEALVRYGGAQEIELGSPLLDPEPAYDYVIITTDVWDEYLGDFVELKNSRGLRTGVFLKSWILDRYSGIDEQEQIRSFIIDAYQTWGTEYVLLVGDTREENGIPHRGLYATVTDGGSTQPTARPGGAREADGDIPGDIYYAALDGNWNSDGDGWWGEPGEADLYPDIAVGRVCVNEYWEIENFTDKVRYYQQQPIVNECDQALMVGEYLWPSTYGGTYKDEIIYGSSAHGYTTAGISDRMNVQTLYERDDGDWSPSALIFLMESGVNIVNHLGHCNLHHVMKLSPVDISAFTNDGTEHSLNFIYTQGCYSGAFDNKVIGGGYTYDCFIELMAVAQVGAAACVANSRYGWGEIGGTNGSSQYFDREFFDAMFGEGIYDLGYANNDSKADVVWAIDYGANRWCSYQLNLFGDPAMQLWTGEPAALTVERPTLILTDAESMEVTVRGAGDEPVEGARVAVYTDDGYVYDSGYTDASGIASVDARTPVSGTLHLRVMAHDYLDHESDIPVISATEPYLDLVGQIVDDDNSGGSYGNGDGVLNAGETVELFVSFENLGGGEASSVSALLSCDSPDVSITQEEVDFGGIAPHSTVQGATPFVLEVAPDSPDGEILGFSLDVFETARGSWAHGFDIAVSAPVIEYAWHELDDSAGNGNGCPEAGESISLELSLANTGSAQATGVAATLSTTDNFVVINNGTLSGMTIDSGETAVLDGEYSLTLLPGCPSSHEIQLDVIVEADLGYATTAEVAMLTAETGFTDDIEGELPRWYHEPVTEGSADAWHVESWRSRSGDYSWKFGGDGYESYPPSSDGALLLAPICVAGGGELRFWDWLQAEEESGSTGWDCALVEASTDFGATWELLEPVGGYTHTKAWSTGNPVPNGTPCWSGSHDWREEVFDLSHLVGQSAMIRLRFASDEFVGMEGWYVDDVQISFDESMAEQEQVARKGVPHEFALRQNVPNPFNPVTTIRYELPVDSHVAIDIYNVAGRHVTRLVDGQTQAGYREAVWDGTDGSGHRVASGVYLYSLTTPGYESKRMMVLLK